MAHLSDYKLRKDDVLNDFPFVLKAFKAVLLEQKTAQLPF